MGMDVVMGVGVGTRMARRAHGCAREWAGHLEGWIVEDAREHRLVDLNGRARQVGHQVDVHLRS